MWKGNVPRATPNVPSNHHHFAKFCEWREVLSRRQSACYVDGYWLQNAHHTDNLAGRLTLATQPRRRPTTARAPKSGLGGVGRHPRPLSKAATVRPDDKTHQRFGGWLGRQSGEGHGEVGVPFNPVPRTTFLRPALTLPAIIGAGRCGQGSRGGRRRRPSVPPLPSEPPFPP